MAIAFQASSYSSGGAGDFSWLHSYGAFAGTIKGIIVQIVQDWGTTNEIISVTYGGVALSLVSAATVYHTNGSEDGTVYTFFLGTGIPTINPSTIAVTVTGAGSGSDKFAGAVSVTADTDTQILGSATLDSASESIPQVVINQSVACLVMGALHTGTSSTVNITEGTEFTLIRKQDFGPACGSIIYRIATAGSDLPVYWNTTAGEEAGIGAISISELVGTSINSNISLFINGSIPINNNITLQITAPANQYNSLDPLKLYTKGTPIGITELFTYNELFANGYLTNNNNSNLYIIGKYHYQDGNNLYIYGKDLKNNNLNLFIKNAVTPSGVPIGLILVIKGLDPAASVPPSSGNINKYTTLYSYGGAISVGAGATSSSSATYSPLTQLNMFLKGAVSDDHTSNMNMFIGGQWFAKANSTTLFMYNRIEPLNGNTKLYVRGLGSVDSEGYTPGGSYMNLYIARNTAGAANLFMIGPKYNINNTINLYINSNPTSNNNVALSLPYSWSNLNNGVNTYVNGW